MKHIPECEINLITLTTLFFAFCVFVAFEIPGVVLDFYETSNFVDKPLYSNLQIVQNFFCFFGQFCLVVIIH